MGDRVKQLGLVLDPPEAPVLPRAGSLRSFHVRSHVTVSEALEGERRAGKQDQAILQFFHTYPGRWTPSDVHREFPDWPITSVRRSLTTLTTRGFLTHHPQDRRQGPHGVKESVWSLSK